MAQDHSQPHDLTVRRACLPEILFIPDVAVALSVSESAARRAVLRGDCGPYLRIGRRLAVRRDSFLAALQLREISPATPGESTTSLSLALVQSEQSEDDNEAIDDIADARLRAHLDPASRDGPPPGSENSEGKRRP